MATESFRSETSASTGMKATVIGVILQLAMVGIGHAVPSVRAMWGAGGTLISLVVGVWAGSSAATTTAAVIWGAVAGGLGAFIGIALAVVLGDVPATLLLLGTIASTVAGIVGAFATYKVRHW